MSVILSQLILDRVNKFAFCLSTLALFLLSTPAYAVEAKPRDPVTIWEELSDLGGLKKVERQKKEKALFKESVEIGGYIIANEFGDAKVTEFLLTQIPGGCVHVPLPPPEKMIHVQMAKDKSSAVFFGKRVIVKGRLSKGERIDSTFEVLGEEVKEFPLK